MPGAPSKHIVETTVRRILEKKQDPEWATSEVMAALEELRLVSYRSKNVLPLLSVAGRVLVVIMENPDLSIREMAVRLGVHESNVQRSVSELARHGLVSRRRVGRQNVYAVNVETLLAHPDVWRFVVALNDTKPDAFDVSS